MTAHNHHHHNNNVDDDDDWLTLESKMTSILSSQKSAIPIELSLAQQVSHLLHTLTTEHSHRLHSDSTKIQSSVTQSIQAIEQELQTVHQELSLVHTTLHQLSSSRQSLTSSLQSYQNQLSSIQSNILQYEHTINKDKEYIQLLENQHVKQLPKIQNELTLYVAMTNIKWNYTTDGTKKMVLGGEVSYMEKGVLRKFEIDIEELLDCEKDGGEVVIADRLWEIIEG
jgi:hypothetical protein